MPRAARGFLVGALILSWLLSSGGLAIPRVAAAPSIVTSGDDAGPGSLRQAIADAAPGDTITFAPAITTVTLTTAELTIDKDLTIQGSGQGGVRVERSSTVGTPEFRLFHVTTGTVTIRGLTIANGKTGSDDHTIASNAGGAVRVSGGSLHVADSAVRDSSATLGGGLAVVGPNILSITRTTVQGNSAFFGGGVISHRGTAILTHDIVSDNEGYEGGGLSSYQGTLIVADTTINDNSADGPGGGVSNREGFVSLKGNVAIRGNAARSGGGIESFDIPLASGGSASHWPITSVVNTTISGNSATAFGGGVAVGPGEMTLFNATISGNSADEGGGLASYFGKVTLDQVTLTGNNARLDGGITIYGTGEYPASAKIWRSIVAGNPNDDCSTNDVTNAPLSSLGYNVVGAGCPGDGAGDILFNGAIADLLDPGLADNGGPTQTHALVPGSPALNSIPSDECAPFGDQRGVKRPQGPGCDAGAYEHDWRSTNLAVDNATGANGDTATLRATLTEMEGEKSLAGRVVAFTLNGVAACGVTGQPTCPITDADGIAQVVGVSLAGIVAGTYPTGVGASFAGDAHYLASAATAGLTVNRLSQGIAFNPLPVWSQDNPSLVMSAIGGESGNPIVFGTATPAVCTAGAPMTATSATVTLLASGACTITADQAGNDVYAPAPRAHFTFIVPGFPCAGRFADVPDTDPACAAIAALTSQGIINGYATDPPTFGPHDSVQRAQMAAFLVRALHWQDRPAGPRTFTDFGGLIAELRTASLILANACDDGDNFCVIRGYGDGRFGPTDQITYAQVITFIARAFELDETRQWSPQPGGAQPYGGIPAIHDEDIRTYRHYAGAIPDAPSTGEGWNTPAPRAWVAQVLFQALQATP